MRSSACAVSRCRCACDWLAMTGVYRVDAIHRQPAARLVSSPMARRTVVVKVGSSSLVDDGGRPRPRLFGAIARDLAELAYAGTPVVLVSSGAIAIGLGRRR